MILLHALMHDERGGTLLSSFWYACVPRIVGASKSQFCCRPSRAVRNELVPCLRVLGLEGECRLTHGRTRQPRIEDRQTLPELRSGDHLDCPDLPKGPANCLCAARPAAFNALDRDLHPVPPHQVRQVRRSQVLVVPTLFRVANCCCRGSPSEMKPDSTCSLRTFQMPRFAKCDGFTVPVKIALGVLESSSAGCSDPWWRRREWRRFWGGRR